MPPKQEPKQIVIRNLTHLPFVRRIPSSHDPFVIRLARRGERGDMAGLPPALLEHPDVIQDMGRFYERITPAEAGEIQYSYDDPWGDDEKLEAQAERRRELPDRATYPISETLVAKRRVIEEPTIRLQEGEVLRRVKSAPKMTPPSALPGILPAQHEHVNPGAHAGLPHGKAHYASEVDVQKEMRRDVNPRIVSRPGSDPTLVTNDD